MYVITGATGNTGSVVAKKLLEQGKKVRVIGRSAERLTALATRGAEPFVGDVTDTEAMNRAFSGAKAVEVMIPPDMTTQDFRAYQDKITDTLTSAIEKNKVEPVVVLSSI